MAVVAMKLAFIATMKSVLLKIKYMDEIGADVVLTRRIRNDGCENSNATSASNRFLWRVKNVKEQSWWR